MSVKDPLQFFVFVTSIASIILLLLSNYVESASFGTTRPEGTGGIQRYENGRKVPEYIQSSILKYCEKCSDSQRKTVEDVLLLLFSLDPDQKTSENSSKFKQKLKKTLMKAQKHKKPTTLNPRDRWPSVPAPEVALQYYNVDNFQQQQVIPFPTTSTTPSGVGSPSTTVSSAPAPAQSVEMPTPPTATYNDWAHLLLLPECLSSSSLQPPTTSELWRVVLLKRGEQRCSLEE
ncbi:hypothetical protein Ocin01_07684 [Orchesella cincta]|uniref:Uncharacterized protein n=1 Tax=Orchesella cincta TaxID=48709 RepID=A0A1D2N130_ORCCI|nr:hypothetical protein Ocin01_07684 [Orchesella cincta]